MEKIIQLIWRAFFMVFLFVNSTSYATYLELYMADPEVRIAQKIYCQIKDVSSTDKIKVYLDNILIFEKNGNLKEEEVFIADYRSLKADNHELRVIVLDENETVLASVSKEWKTLHDGIPKVGINENNAICVNGKPFFPITTFMLDKSKFSDWPNKAPFDISSCINTLYAEGYYPVHDINSWKDYIQSGWDKGWYVAGPERWDGFNSESPRDSDTNKLAEYVNYTKDMPGLFAWNWDDEPNTGGSHEYNPATTCREWMKITHANDTNHPVWNLYYGYDYTHDGSEWHHNRIKEYSYLYNENIFGEKTAVADVISLDYYPYEYESWHEWVSLDDYTLALDRAREWNYDLFPIATCIETQDLHDPNAEGHNSPCGWALRNGRSWTPGPTPQELKNLIWVSIIHGVKSIQLFHWFCSTPEENIATLIEAKINIESLAPVILGPEEEKMIISDEELDGGRIDILVKKYEGKIYLFAANIMVKNERVKFKFPELTHGTNIEVYDEDRNIIANQGYFEDSFSELDVHIYTIADKTSSTDYPERLYRKTIELYQNYPNPFNPKTEISFFLETPQHVTLKIFDTTGQTVATPLDEWQPSGFQKFIFNGRDLPSGVYFYKIITNAYQRTKKMLIVK